MKSIFTLFLLNICFTLSAQWSNTTNQFYDSLDMPVTQAANDQVNPLIIKSDPDGGYFVIWEDYRVNGVGVADIYSQKYDKNGVALWTLNGVPVASGPTNQQYSNSTVGYSGNNDYRNISHAASDGSGGFYIGYADNVRIGSYDYSRVCVQHVLSNGTVVFGNTGYIIGDPYSPNSTEFSSPQLVSDGKGGFFIGFAEGTVGNSANNMAVQLYCYKDEGGTLKRYGGNIMNYYTSEHSTDAACGLRFYFDTPDKAFGLGFFIFPDLQNGCGVIMVEQLQNSQSLIIGYNRLCRVKKDCHTTVSRRSNDIAIPVISEHDYKKDSVVMQYNYATYSQYVSCLTGPDFQTLVAYTNYYVEQGGQGLRPLTTETYGLDAPNAKMIATDGNIDACLVTWNQRDYNYSTNALGNWYTRSFTLPIEKYDSLPYELCSDLTHPYNAYRPVPVDGEVLDKLNLSGFGRIDTLIKTGSAAQYEYTLSASGNRLFLATNSVASLDGSKYSVYYQELNLERKAPDSFALNLATPTQNGIALGSDAVQTRYRYPMFAPDGNGNALFYMGEYNSYIHASPVAEGGKLLWGSLGLPISAGISDGRYSSPDIPFAFMDNDGKAVIAWQDQRKTPAGYTGLNIYMRHLDSLTVSNYTPPLRKVRSLGTTTSIGIPQVLNGSSHAWTPLLTGVYDPAVGVVDYSAPVEIKDDYNLGTVSVQTYQNGGPIRTTPDGKPYLNRNYTISVTNHPVGATISIRLIFTKAEFDALKAADPSIQTPGDLSVIKQPNTGGNVPAVYTPAAGDQGVQPLSWGAIDASGYYIELAISDFSNFFITKSQGALPLTWLDVAAERINPTEAQITWQVAQEMNIKKYNVQLSNNGTAFSDVCTVPAKGSAAAITYSCIVPVENTIASYLRVEEVDNDGHNFYSPIVKLQPTVTTEISITPNPAKDYALLHLPASNTIKNILLVNGYGSIVWQLPSGSAPLPTIRIPLATLAAGIYYVKVMDAGGFKIFKIIKSN